MYFICKSWLLYSISCGCFNTVCRELTTKWDQKKTLHTQVKNQNNGAKKPLKYTYMNKQLMNTHIFNICNMDLWQITEFIFILFVFLTEILFLPFENYLVHFANFLKITTHFPYSWTHFPDSWPSCSLQRHYQVFQLAYKQTLYSYLISQQITKIFRKLLVCIKLLWTKLMVGINIYYLHMWKIYIFISL